MREEKIISNIYGNYDKDKQLFYPNEHYKQTLDKIINATKPNQFYHLCLNTKIENEIFVYESISTEVNINTIIFIGNDKIFYVNDKGHKIQESYEWKINRTQ